MNAAPVAEISDAGAGLVQLALTVPPEIEKSFTVPGQYLELNLPGYGARPYAIASAPFTTNRFEFLLRRGSSLADELVILQPGHPVLVSKARGPGFPIDAAKGKDLLLVATGTGAAPMRSVIEHLGANRADFAEVVFYFGGRHGNDFAFERDWPRWDSLRVKLVRTVSETDPAWQGLRGFVQDHFAPIRWGESAAFVVGSNPMVQAVTAALVKRGMEREHIFLNL